MRSEPIPCLCCGYRTIDRAVLERYAEDECGVCDWQYDAVEPWEVSVLNWTTPVEAQHAFLTGTRPVQERDDLRAPLPSEARDPDWRPFERTPDLLAKVERGWIEHQRREAEEQRRHEREARRIDDVLRRVNVGVEEIRSRVATLDHDEAVRRLAAVYRQAQMDFPPGWVEMTARTIRDDAYYRDHPEHVEDWLARFSTRGRREQDAEMLRTGIQRFAG